MPQGRDAVKFLQGFVTSDVTALEPGSAQESTLCRLVERPERFPLTSRIPLAVHRAAECPRSSSIPWFSGTRTNPRPSCCCAMRRDARARFCCAVVTSLLSVADRCRRGRKFAFGLRLGDGGSPITTSQNVQTTCQGVPLFPPSSSRSPFRLTCDCACVTQVKMADVSDAHQVWAAVPNHAQNDLSADSLVGQSGDIGYADPRHPSLGFRGLCQDSPLPTGVEEAPLPAYNILRMSCAAPDNTVDVPMGESFPLEHNLESLGAISFRKGCYLGQELTARTFHTGKTRKRLAADITLLPRQGKA